MDRGILIDKNTGGDQPESWKKLYPVAGFALLVTVGFVLLDMVLSFMGGDVEVGRLGAVDWFDTILRNWFLGLRNLGLFNVINLTLTIPLYLALYRLHSKAAPAGAALALIVFLLGTGVYIANNQAMTMLALSDQYAAAATEAQKSLITAAGTVILAQAEDFTPGTFMGFFLSSTGTLLMTAVMLHGGIFRRWIGLAGLVGTGTLLFFTISVTFVPSSFQFVMVLAMLGGLLMIAWDIAVALALFRLARTGETQLDRSTVSTSMSIYSEGL